MDDTVRRCGDDGWRAGHVLRPGHRPRRRRRPGPGVRPLLGALLVGAVLAATLVQAEPPERAQIALPDAVSPPAEVALDPRAFAPGGCVVLPPLRNREPMAIVALDAGHGGPDPGGTTRPGQGPMRQEKDLTLALVSAAAQQLRERGVAVVLTRSQDALGSRLDPDDVQAGALTTSASQDDLTSRVRCANLSRADALVSVHLNSFDQPGVTGAEALFEAHRPQADQSLRLARSVHGSVVDALGTRGDRPVDRGIVDDSAGGEGGGEHLVLLGPRVPGYIDEPSAMPATLLEPLFITNPAALDAIDQPKDSALLGQAIADGVQTYLSRPP